MKKRKRATKNHGKKKQQSTRNGKPKIKRTKKRTQPISAQTKKKKTALNKGGQRGKSIFVSFLGEARLFVSVLIVTLFLFFGGVSLFYSIKQVSGYGMMPVFRDSDVLLIKKNSEFQRFDIVYLMNGLEGDFRRIVGLPREKISYQDDRLFVNDQPVDEKFIIDKINESQAKGKNFTEDSETFGHQLVSKIPEAMYLVMGDNRPHTTDSREYGLISQDVIGGKVIARLFPLDTAEKF